MLGEVGRLPVEGHIHRWATCFILGLYTLVDAPSEVEFAEVEHLREEWMRVVMDSGLAAVLGKVMQEDPGCHSLSLLPKQSMQCTLVGHDMAHWLAMVKSWGVLVSPPPCSSRHMPVLGICLIQGGQK